MSIIAVIFDLDGTITRPYFDFDMIRAEMGLTRQDGPVWEAMLKMPPDRLKKVQQILDYHEQKAIDESELNTGAKETLESLREKQIKIGILTRNKAQNAWAVSQKHNLIFDEVLGREDGPVKPDAFGILELCRRFGAEPQETLMVGDYLFDIECGMAAKAVTVLLANHPQADEFAIHADYKIDRITQILEIIEEKKNE
ncbi:MAG: HAD family hydrolase [Sedimentisphaerales bacterium]|nr:HAD family hydrolase [Sedimentisphaerales bacterium]